MLGAERPWSNLWMEQVPDPNQEQEQSFGMRVGARLRDILWHSDYDILEVAISIPVALFSIVLLNPWVNTFQTSTSFRAMQDWSPEAVWGALGLSLAMLQVYASLVRNPQLRVLAPALMAMYLTLVSLLIGLANPWGTAVGTYVGLAIWAWILMIRCARDLA